MFDCQQTTSAEAQRTLITQTNYNGSILCLWKDFGVRQDQDVHFARGGPCGESYLKAYPNSKHSEETLPAHRPDSADWQLAADDRRVYVWR